MCKYFWVLTKDDRDILNGPESPVPINGGGKRLFASGTIPAAFQVTEGTVTPSGVIVANYERAGAVTTKGANTTTTLV